ncbi:MAG: hypothetical protein KJ065_13305 [Anaerolineae bacterium]|nr:hypothetical protein [Anaerolineae bacterium]
MTTSRDFLRNAYVKRILLVVFTLLIAFALVRCGLLASSAAPNIRGVEPNVAYTIQATLSEDSLYPDPTVPSFAITQYTPLYYIIVIDLSRALGLVPGVDVVAIYQVGRGLSLVFAVAMALSTFALLRTFGTGLLLAAFILTLALILPIPWNILLRPDALATCLGLSTVYLYSWHLWRASRGLDARRDRLTLFATGVCGFLAALTKQNFALFLGIVLVFAGFRRRYVELIWLAAGAALALFLTSAIWRNYYSLIPGDGNFFFANVIGGIDNGTDFQRAVVTIYSIYFTWFLPLFVLPLAALALMLRTQPDRRAFFGDPILPFLCWAFVITTGVNLISGLKVGSAIHYMTESMIIGSLFVVRSLMISRPLQAFVQRPRVAALSCLIAIIYALALSVNDMLLYSKHYHVDASHAYPAELINFMEAELAQSPEAYFLAWEPRILNNVFFKHALFPQYEISLINYALHNEPYAALPQLLQEGRFRYVVMPESVSPPRSVFGESFGELRLIATVSGNNIYEITPP